MRNKMIADRRNYFGISYRITVTAFPKDPAVLKTREHIFEGINVCNSQDNGVHTRRAAIVNRYAIVNLPRRANLLRRSIFSTAGSLGSGVWELFTDYCDQLC